MNNNQYQDRESDVSYQKKSHWMRHLLVGLTLMVSSGSAYAEDASVDLLINVSPLEFTSVGQQITIYYTVVNTGTEGAEDISVEDSLLSNTVCEIGLLSPGYFAVCTGVYFATPADMAAGKIVSDATAYLDTDEAATEYAKIYLQGHKLDMTVMANPETFTAEGEVITYYYKVTNISNQPLAGVGVSDPLVGGDVCSGVSLWPGATVICTQVYTTTAADVTAGSVANTATGVAGGANPTMESATVTLDAPE